MTQATAPTRIWEIADANQDWFAMLAGMQLDLFTPLGDGPLTAGELALALGVDAEKLSLLLYALVVAELLTVEDGRFANTEESAEYLVRGKPAYMGSAHTLWAEFGAAGLKTAESVRTGVPQAKHDFATMSEDELFTTLGGLHAGALARGRALAARYDFGAYRDVLDVAGGSGGVSITLVEACPNLRATITELPSVIPVARRFIGDAGLDDRIETIFVDMLREPVPGQFDAAVVCYFLQILSADDAQAALHNVEKSLRPGGTIYIINHVLDDSHLTPLVPARLNVLLLSFYDRGQAYTESEHRTWLTNAGFVDIVREEEINGNGVLVARKPA